MLCVCTSVGSHDLEVSSFKLLRPTYHVEASTPAHVKFEVELLVVGMAISAVNAAPTATSIHAAVYLSRDTTWSADDLDLQYGTSDSMSQALHDGIQAGQSVRYTDHRGIYVPVDSII